MDDESADENGRIRREDLLGSSALLAGGLLAGCTGTTGSGPTATATGQPAASTPAEESTPEPTPAGESTASATESAPETEVAASNEPYTVSMVPVGEVEYDSIPETWVGNNSSWADRGVALGLEAPMGGWLTARYHTHYPDEIPGVSISTENIVSLGQDGVNTELFYELEQTDVAEKLFDRPRVGDVVNRNH